MISPFQQSLNTFAILVTGVSSAAVQLSDDPSLINNSVYTLRVYNVGPNDAFIRLSTNSAAAVTPVPGAPTPAYPLPVGVVELISAAPDVFITAICPTGTATLYCTPGFGI